MALAACFSSAYAQEPWPSKPVRFIVPSNAGGSPDRVTRLIAERLARKWGQPTLVENKAGATSIIGTEYVAKAAPDGYTLLFATSSTHATNPTTFVKLPYDPVKDFSPVGLVCVNPLVLVTHPSMPDTLPGTPTGPISPNQPSEVASGSPASARVGRSGHADERLEPLDASARNRPSRTIGEAEGTVNRK